MIKLAYTFKTFKIGKYAILASFTIKEVTTTIRHLGSASDFL